MIGKKILELRKNNHLSQEELAEKIDVTRQTISNWETGETVPDLKQANSLANVFNISLDELMGSNKGINEKLDKNIHNSKKILKIVKIVLLVVVIILILISTITSMIFLSMDYFTAKPSGSGIGTNCYRNDVYYKYLVMKDYTSGKLSLETEDMEIIDKFKVYDYNNEEKMLNDIVDYITNNGGYCEMKNE